MNIYVFDVVCVDLIDDFGDGEIFFIVKVVIVLNISEVVVNVVRGDGLIIW